MPYEMIDADKGLYRSDLVLDYTSEGEQAWTPEVAVDLGGSWQIVEVIDAGAVMVRII